MPGNIEVLPSTGADPALLYLARLSEGSRRAQRHALRVLSQILWHGAPGQPGGQPRTEYGHPWHLLTPPQTLAVRTRLIADYAPATARRILAALRGVIQESWRAGLLTSDQRDRLCDLPPIRFKREPAGRALTQEEVRALIYQADADELVMLALLLGGGLRRAEASRVRVEDVDAEPGKSLIRLRVLGKGDRERHIQIAGRFGDWLRRHRHYAVLYGTGLRRLFLLPWTPGQIASRLARLAERSHIAPCTPHDLRRTFCSTALAAGIDLATVQAAMGHADPRTTAAYDRRGADAQQHLATRLATALEVG